MGESFFVSVIDGPRKALLAGPYETHEEALSKVDEARTKAESVDPRAVFYAFGTCRVEWEIGPPLALFGKLDM